MRINLGIPVSPELYNSIKERAKEQNITTAEYVRRLINEDLEFSKNCKIHSDPSNGNVAEFVFSPKQRKFFEAQFDGNYNKMKKCLSKIIDAYIVLNTDK
jgi:hypothetical protein